MIVMCQQHTYTPNHKISGIHLITLLKIYLYNTSAHIEWKVTDLKTFTVYRNRIHNKHNAYRITFLCFYFQFSIFNGYNMIVLYIQKSINQFFCFSFDGNIFFFHIQNGNGLHQ